MYRHWCIKAISGYFPQFIIAGSWKQSHLHSEMMPVFAHQLLPEETALYSSRPFLGEHFYGIRANKSHVSVILFSQFAL